MQRFVKCSVCSIFVCAFLAFPSLLTASELIEPTRTLKGTIEQPGKLSVFSEPPELQVILDGTGIGKTPVLERTIEPGTHTIQIKDSTTEIYVVPGKTAQYSWFKGSFIQIPLAAKAASPTPSATKEKVPPEEKPAKPDERELKLQPLYWPLDPRGAIF